MILGKTPILIFILFLSLFADEITIVADQWCPFNCDPKSKKPGYMIEIAKTVFLKAGHTVLYSNLDWDKAIKDTRQGTYTAIVGAYKEDAPDFIFPKQSLGVAGNAFFVKEGSSWKYNGTASLKQIKVGIIKGYSYGDILDAAFKNQKKAGNLFVSAGDNALENLINSLIDGKIDVIIEDPAVLSDYLVENAMFDILDMIVEVGNEGDKEPVYIAFSPKNPKSKEYAELLNKGIEELIQTNEALKIIQKYKIKKWW